MKKLGFLIATLLSLLPQTYAQMTLANNFPGDSIRDIQIVNLSRSGKKYATMSIKTGAPSSDTIFLYNTDYSFWKMIPCPIIPGYFGRFALNYYNLHVSYISEALFNTDTFVEAAVYYSSTTAPNDDKQLIINENGTIVDSILHASAAFGIFTVHDMGSGHFQATISTTTGPKVFNLPGTLPCDACGGGLGLAKTETDKNLISAPIPNPSKDEVKISFTLPEGASRGELNIYNTNGQKVRSYQVDNRFGFIMVDNSQLVSGTYYYNITSNGTVTASQKMLVIR